MSLVIRGREESFVFDYIQDTFSSLSTKLQAFFVQCNKKRYLYLQAIYQFLSLDEFKGIIVNL